MNKPSISGKTGLLAWAGLMGGFVLTLVLSQTRMGRYYTVLALMIAAAQALVVIAYFMHARSSSRLTWLFAVAGIYWLGILFAFGLADYFSRGWIK